MSKHERFGLSVFAIIVLLAIYFFQEILSPFIAAAILSYLANPLMNMLTRLKLPRALSAGVLLLAIIWAVFLLVENLIPLLITQVQVGVTQLPGALNQVINWLQPYAQHFGFQIAMDLATFKQHVLQQWQSASEIATEIGMIIARSSKGILRSLIHSLFALLITFYLLKDGPSLIKLALSKLPMNARQVVSRWLNESNEVLGAFFRGELVVMFCLACVYSFGLSLAGLQIALLIGILTGIFSIIPYLGVACGFIAALLAAVFQFHDLWHMVYVTLAFAVGHILEGTFLTPVLVGKRIGLHPVAVILAVLAGGECFGFAGVLLALPTAAVLRIALAHFWEHYVMESDHGSTTSA
jgi:predicted PurR-regulated permease PerM